jgi:hypothetical protein
MDQVVEHIHKTVAPKQLPPAVWRQFDALVAAHGRSADEADEERDDTSERIYPERKVEDSGS